MNPASQPLAEGAPAKTVAWTLTAAPVAPHAQASRPAQRTRRLLPTGSSTQSATR
jgi:hypothetical protein